MKQQLLDKYLVNVDGQVDAGVVKIRSCQKSYSS